MARQPLLSHRKFRRLTAALDGNDALALGSLELIWHTCYETGDPLLGAAEDVEAMARWKGEPGVVFKALVGAGGKDEPGFIEEVQGKPGRYQVHDFWDHAPTYVKARMEREMARRNKGVTLSQLRAEAGKKGAAAIKEKRGGFAFDDAEPKGKKPEKVAAAAPPPAPVPPPPQPKEPKVRATRPSTVRKVSQDYTPELMDTAAEMIEMWHRQDPKDGRVIEVSLPMLAMRLQAITQSDPRYTLELCMAGAKAYLAEKRERYSAAHYFFGVGKAPEGPKYPAYLDAILAARGRRQQQEVG